MRYNNLTRTAVLGTAAVVCFGVAGPASAHTTGASAEHAKTGTAPTAAQVKAAVNAFIAQRLRALDAAAAKLATDPSLSAARKAEIAAKLTRQRTALSTLRSAVASASTVADVRQAIRTAMAAEGRHGFFGWCGFYDPAGADRATVRPAAHPTRSGAGVHTVVLRNAAPAQAPAGQHRTSAARQHADRDHGYRARHGFGSGGGFAAHNGGGHHR